MFQHFKRNVENIMGAFIQWDSLLSMARSLFFSFYYWWTMPSGLKAEDVISLWSWLCQEWKKFPFLHSWHSQLLKEITSSAFIYYLSLRCHSNKPSVLFCVNLVSGLPKSDLLIKQNQWRKSFVTLNRFPVTRFPKIIDLFSCRLSNFVWTDKANNK